MKVYKIEGKKTVTCTDYVLAEDEEHAQTEGRYSLESGIDHNVTIKVKELNAKEILDILLQARDEQKSLTYDEYDYFEAYMDTIKKEEKQNDNR